MSSEALYSICHLQVPQSASGISTRGQQLLVGTEEGTVSEVLGVLCHGMGGVVDAKRSVVDTCLTILQVIDGALTVHPTAEHQNALTSGESRYPVIYDTGHQDIFSKKFFANMSANHSKNVKMSPPWLIHPAQKKQLRHENTP